MSARPRILALFGARVIFGAERENIESLAALRGQGCEILCLVRDEVWNHAIPEALRARGLACAPVPYIDGWLPGWRLHILLRNPIAFVVGNWRFLGVVRKFHPTHIHAFGPLYILSFLPGLLLVRTPMVYRAGEKPILHRRFWRALWRFIMMRTSRFVPVSRFIAGELQATGIAEKQIQVIYGRPPERLNTKVSSAIPPQDDGKRDVIFIGQIIEGKGLHLLIDAFRSVAQSCVQARLLIAGRISEWRGDDWARELQVTVAHDPVLQSRVIFLGFVENVPELLRYREILVVPSLVEEGLGLVVLEAKAVGVPSIVFPSGGLPEMIEHGVDGFICRDKSVEALTEALKLYLTNPSLSQRQGAAAKASLRRLGTEEFAHRWLAVYERTM